MGVVAHNLDDAGDVEQVGGPFATRTEAEAEAQTARPGNANE